MNRVAVGLVVDSALVREGLVRMIAPDPEFVIVWEGEDIQQVPLSQLRAVDLLLLGCRTGEEQMAKSLQFVRESSPRTRVIGIGSRTHSLSFITNLFQMGLAG